MVEDWQITAIGGLFFWFRTDTAVLAGANALGLDDSSGWIAANSQMPEVMETLEAANVGMLRVELPWQAVELSPGAFSWTVEGEQGTTDFPALFNRLERHGVFTTGPEKNCSVAHPDTNRGRVHGPCNRQARPDGSGELREA